jgi:hypothetical protein
MKNTKSNPLDEYYKNTQNITFEEIKNTSYKETLENICKDGNSFTDYGYYKYFIKKNEKINLSKLRLEIDIFFGIYSQNDCEFQINITNIGLFQKGNILKNKLRFINTIPVVSLIYEDEIFVETTEDSYLLFTCLGLELRKFFSLNSILIDKFTCKEGKIFKNAELFDKYKLPLCRLPYEIKKEKIPKFENYGIKDKIDSMNETNEYQEKYDLILTEDNKESIMKNFDLLDYYITKKMDGKVIENKEKKEKKE